MFFLARRRYFAVDEETRGQSVAHLQPGVFPGTDAEQRGGGGGGRRVYTYPTGFLATALHASSGLDAEHAAHVTHATHATLAAQAAPAAHAATPYVELRVGSWAEGDTVAVVGGGDSGSDGWWEVMRVERAEVVVMADGGGGVGGAGGAGVGGAGGAGVTLADRVFNGLVTGDVVHVPAAVVAAAEAAAAGSGSSGGSGDARLSPLITERIVARRHASHSPHILSLEIGETVHVLETLADGTCYGATLGPETTFPSTYVSAHVTVYGDVAVVQHAYDDPDGDGGAPLEENDIILVTERTEGDGWWTGRPIIARGVFRGACLADDARARERRGRARRQSTAGGGSGGGGEQGGNRDLDDDESESDEEFDSDAEYSEYGDGDHEAARAATVIDGQPLYRVLEPQAGSLRQQTLATAAGDLVLVLSHGSGAPDAPVHALLLAPLLAVPARCIEVEEDGETGTFVGAVVVPYRIPGRRSVTGQLAYGCVVVFFFFFFFSSNFSNF
jgi:hypothetical protein